MVGVKASLALWVQERMEGVTGISRLDNSFKEFCKKKRQKFKSGFKRRYFKYGRINSMFVGSQRATMETHPQHPPKTAIKEKGRTERSIIFEKKMECSSQPFSVTLAVYL